MVERTAEGRIRTTEWEDIQYKHGNCVGQYRDKELEIMLQKLKDQNPDLHLEAYDPTAEKVRDKAERGGFDGDVDLDGPMDGDGGGDGDGDGPSILDDDDELLAAFRAKRKAQMKAEGTTAMFGVVRRISAAEYVKEITQSSAGGKWVVACLVAKGMEDCDALVAVLEQLAPRHRDVKFVVADVQECVPKFPRKETPYVLYYKDEKAQSHTVGLEAWGGAKRLSVDTAEYLLRRQGVLPKDDDDEEDPDSTARSKYYQKMHAT